MHKSRLLSFPSVFGIVLSSLAIISFANASLAHAYTINISTEETISIDTSTSGGATIHDSYVDVVTDCRAGYTLTMSGDSNDTTLYLGGDSSYSTDATGHISPVDGTSTLSSSSNTNKWGYYVTNDSTVPTTSSVFLPLPTSSSPVSIRTPLETVSESDIDERVPVYFGTNTDLLKAGTYRMSNDSVSTPSIVYYATTDPSCTISLDLSFDDNTEDTVTGLPTMQDVTIAGSQATLPSTKPTRSGYTFKEWNTEDDGTGSYFYAGQTITIGNEPGELSGMITLYAMWVEDCASSTICYNANHADAGTMDAQTGTSGSTVPLIPSNFSRAGYAFTGWNTEADGSGTQYGPNQNFQIQSNGTNLYAQWLAPTGTLQTWSGASSMNTGDVIALRDNRDNEVYMVAKLADGNVWTAENLRLVPNTSSITALNTNNPTQTFLNTYGSSSTSEMCFSDNSTCNDSVKFNTNNINRGLTANYTNNDNASSWYSYGVMYNWYTATAGNGTYALTSSNAQGDLCPAGWHLPSGGSNGEWGALNTAVNNGNGRNDAGLRVYPVNIIRSGDYNPKNVAGDGRGTQGRMWSTTPVKTDAKNAYRMGYSGSEVNAATSKSWNKWDAFAIRCIYQGGNIPYSNVTVSFPSGETTTVASVTFVSNDYGTVTATLQNPTVALAKNSSYTVTANTAAGYELATWSTDSYGTLSSTSTNPTNYTITGDAVLTVTTAVIPSYTVTTTLGENVSSLSFTHPDYGTITITPQSETCTDNHDDTYTCTVSLLRGVPYVATATFTEGHTLDSWEAGTGSAVSSISTNPTTYTISSVSTLDVTAKEADELTYTLVYDAGSGTDAPASVTVTSYDSTYDFTITNFTPIYYGYTFTGWTETQGSSTVAYTSGDTITVTSTGLTTTKTLYPVYVAVTACPAGKICYYENGADVLNGGRGTMGNQTATSSSTAKLIPTNYSRTGYGFAGWTTVATDANNNNALVPDTTYGPNATINTDDLSTTGLALYAKWIAPTGTLQSWRGCNSMAVGSVIALTDTRDNNAYAVAKLADNKCWTIENLRLDLRTANITTANTHNPTSDFITETASSSSSNSLCDRDDDETCINKIQYNTSSINRSLTPNKTGSVSSWYSYGVYYNWYAATAGNGTYSTAAGTNVTGDICPKNWHLPTSTSSGEWVNLNTVVNGGVSNADAGLRNYPVNLVWNGDYKGTGRTSGYSNGRYWSATSYDANNAYRMGHQESGGKGATPRGYYNKWDGFAIRCIRDEVTAEYHDVVVTLPEHVSSITFTSAQYGTETATTQSNTVSLVEGATYTITTNFATGYELDEWTVGSNATLGDSTNNPTTLIITDDTTLTLTTETIPTYTVTVTLDAHSLSASFTNADYSTQTVTQLNATNNGNGTYTGTVTLAKGITYTITGTFDTANDCVFNTWSTTAGGTLGSPTSSTTTYVVTNTTSISLTSKQKTGATTLLPGQDLNAKMKTLAEGENATHNTGSFKIKALRMADSLPDGFTPSSSNTVSVANSEKPIYIFFDNTNNAGIMYFYTDAKDIYMNANSSYAFQWNTSLADISAVANWNTSNVTNMGYMFYCSNALTNIDALSDWDTSNVTDMGAMFYYATTLANIDGASDWDTSSVTNMSSMFRNSSHLANIDGASGWDTGSVTSMNGMFWGASSLTDIDGASGWDTSSVRGMSNMFRNTNSNIDGTAINDWDVRSVTATAGDGTYNNNNFFCMFGSGTGAVSDSCISTYANHPVFTKRSGTWNSEGTFVPDNTTVPADSATYITLNFDEHVEKVTFTNATYGTEEITTSGDNVRIAKNQAYIVTIYLDSGYTVSSWTATSGTITPTDTTTATYTATANDIMTIVSDAI